MPLAVVLFSFFLILHHPVTTTANIYDEEKQQAPTQMNQILTKSRVLGKKDIFIGSFSGSALILLIIFLCCLGKCISKKSKQPPLQGKPVFLDEDGFYNFDLTALERASTEVLGKGSVGTSLKAEVMNGETKTTVTVVVKRLKDVVVTKKEFETRIEALGKMKNQHLIPLRAYYYSKHEKFLVYDYMPASSLFTHLHNGSRGSGQTRLDWEQRMKIALSAAKGVKHLHEVEKIVHGNIKSSNILLQQEHNKDALVSDYGLNTLFEGLSSQNHRVTGYHAPEVLWTREVTFESDVYSFGVLLLELLTDKDPIQASCGKEGIEFFMWVQSFTHEELSTVVFDVELRGHQNIKEKIVKLLQIAKDCVLFEPNQRPPMPKVVRMMEDINHVEIETPSTETQDIPSTITLELE